MRSGLRTPSIATTQPQQDPSDTLARRIVQLRRLLGETSDLATIADYFDTALVSDPRFLDAGRRGQNDRLLCMVRAVLKAVLTDTSPAEALLAHLPEHRLWHGFLMLRSGLVARIIYFDDINRGLCTAGTLTDDMVQHFRFSLPADLLTPIDPDTARVVRLPRPAPGSASNSRGPGPGSTSN